MKNFLKYIKSWFDDSNTVNEKAIVGFIAFFMIIVAFITDIITGIQGKPLVIHEFIFDGFLVIVLGSFMIASVDKWTNKKHDKKDEDESSKES